MQTLPEQQVISSIEDITTSENPVDLSLKLKRKRQPRLQKLLCDLNLLLGRTEEATTQVESCIINLTKLEDWNWLATAFEAKALLTNNPGALQTALKFFSKNLNRRLLTECGFKLVHLSNDHKDFPLALQTMHQIFESNLDSITVIL